MKHTLTQAIDLLKRGEAQISGTGFKLWRFVKILNDNCIGFEVDTSNDNNYAVFTGNKVAFREYPISDLPIIKLSDIVKEEKNSDKIVFELLDDDFKQGDLVEVSNSGLYWRECYFIGKNKSGLFVAETETGEIRQRKLCRKIQQPETITKEEAERILKKKIL